jgi:hypothetical protein
MRLTPGVCFIILIHLGIKATNTIVEGFDTQTIVTRYGSRYWAVYLNGELLAVTVYKKGALAVQQALCSTLPVMVEQSKVSGALH